MAISKAPPLRTAPTTADAFDGARVRWLNEKWHSQDGVLRLRDRQVEENVRFLLGQQWTLYHPTLNRFVDVLEWMNEDERRYRQRPVFNKLLPWFMLTHARMTENPPILSFLPGPDAIDSQLAETLDILFKTVWREIGMTDVIDRLCAWLIPGGRAYIQTRVDLSKGPLVPWVGGGNVPHVNALGQPIVDPMTGQPLFTYVPEGVPFDARGNVAATMDEQGQMQGQAPHQAREGALQVDVLSPLEVRGTWDHQPWHQKRWHMKVSYLAPEEVHAIFGVEAEPDISGDMAGSAGSIQRLLFGAGFFAQPMASSLLTGDVSNARLSDGLVTVREYWEKPCDEPYDGVDLRETADSPGGRLMIATGSTVLRDGPRPARMPYTSSIRSFDFVRVPGRAHGTSPQEMMNPIQRAYNRGWAQLIEHRNLSTNPIRIIDRASGLANADLNNAPGSNVVVNRRPNVIPFEWVAPPPLGQDVYQVQSMLSDELLKSGNLQGNQGELPSKDASGELVKELRFNSDRYLGPTLRRMVEELGRWGEDVIALLPTIMTTERVLTYAGDDNVARTLTVYPHLFEEGKVNVVPDPESMLPEGRGERQARVYAMWKDGAFGMPQSPQAIRQFLEMARFPHLSRTAKPGGVDWTAAEQENGRMMQGEADIPILPWYEHTVHLQVHEGLMKSPEFLKLDPQIQDIFTLHWQAHMNAVQQMMMAQAGQGSPAGGPEDGPTDGRAGNAQPAKPATPARPAVPGGPVAPKFVQKPDGAPNGVQASMPPQLAGV